jgi:hypothetical protein
MLRRSLLLLACFALAPVSAFAEDIHTPAKGTAERKAILDGLRAVGDNPTRIFVVQWLKTDGTWAFVVADPQSPDGSQRYETETALLGKDGAIWAVIDLPCLEEDCDYATELARMQADHPNAPAGIFPKE